MRGTIVGALGVAMALAVATPASAVTHSDSDDAPGRLDLAQVTRTFTNGPFAPSAGTE